MHVDLMALLVEDYDEAISFFVDALQFDLVEDSPATTNSGHPKRWVVVRPPGGGSGLLLAKADGEEQKKGVGKQFFGRVGLFLRVDDFEDAHAHMQAHDVQFMEEPRHEVYGSVAVFRDVSGNKWDLLGPPVAQARP